MVSKGFLFFEFNPRVSSSGFLDGRRFGRRFMENLTALLAADEFEVFNSNALPHGLQSSFPS
jgi:hypothetical protein